MSDQKPTYKELSNFGQCVANTHVSKSISQSVSETAPPASASRKEKESHARNAAIIASRSDALRDIVLDTIGIDALLQNEELVDSCRSKLPKGTQDPRKAARAIRT